MVDDINIHSRVPPFPFPSRRTLIPIPLRDSFSLSSLDLNDLYDWGRVERDPVGGVRERETHCWLLEDAEAVVGPGLRKSFEYLGFVESFGKDEGDFDLP